jgi:hypothetical protein
MASMIFEPGHRSWVSAMIGGPIKECFGCCRTWLRTVRAESEVERTGGGGDGRAEGDARCSYVGSQGRRDQLHEIFNGPVNCRRVVENERELQRAANTQSERCRDAGE